nr:MAG TPA: hypothetical protein [Caudoviricetes sp.]
MPLLSRTCLRRFMTLHLSYIISAIFIFSSAYQDYL